MKTYVAKLVYRIHCLQAAHKPQFDTQLRVISAEDELHAFHKARLLGETESLALPPAAVPAQWHFIDVTELVPLCGMLDGTEIFSSIREEENAETYIREVRRHASRILQQGLQQFTSLNC